MKFNVEKETNKIIKFIKEYFKDNQLDGVVMGISGGKDSTIASALFTKALGKENVIGIAMPCNSIKQDAADAKRVAEHLGFKLYEFDLTETFNTQFEGINKTFTINPEITKEAAVNLKPRLRMSTLYYVAQGLSLQNNKRYIVAGTGNKCEIFVGYFTKFGDGASDINILADLSVSEVVAIGEYLNLPNDLVFKTPSDGLSGKSDEEKLGVTYAEIEQTINLENINPQIMKMHQNISHKLKPITIYKKINVEKVMQKIIEILTKSNKTIATMESCTSGLLASTITNVDDSSKVFKYGANTYSNETKIKMGVNKELIDKYTVYSEEVAKDMANKISEFAGADYGVGITGELAFSNEITKVYISIYDKKQNQYFNETIKIFEKDRALGKEKVIEKTVALMEVVINENQEN